MKSDLCIVDGCQKIKDKKQNRRVCPMHRARYGRYKSYDLPEKKQLPEGVVKICKIHGELNLYQVSKKGKYKWFQCLECKKNSNDLFAEKNPERDTNLMKKFYTLNGSNIKLCKVKFNEMLLAQNSVCAICKMPETIFYRSATQLKLKRLAIDHIHGTDIIRGLLCHKCNVSIGAMGESIERLESAIAYLKKHQSTYDEPAT